MQTKSPILACWPLTYLVGVIHRNKEDKQKKKTRKTNQNQTTIIPTQILFPRKLGVVRYYFLNHTPENAFIYACFLVNYFALRKNDTGTALIAAQRFSSVGFSPSFSQAAFRVRNVRLRSAFNVASVRLYFPFMHGK